MDYCYNNAVTHVFCHLLENSVTRDKALSKDYEGGGSKGKGDLAVERPRNQSKSVKLIINVLIFLS